MKFEVASLESPLSNHLESIFHFKGFTPDHSIERVVPTGHVFILFELDSIPRYTFDNATLKTKQTFTKVWVSGMHKNYISISAPQDSEMFVIQFKAHGAFPFFHFPTAELNDRVLSAETVLSENILTIHDALLSASTSTKKFEVAERWLMQRYQPQKSPPKELLTLIGALQDQPAAGYQKTIEDYPHSQKHLIDQFKKYIGLTPKYYHRILRFNEILQSINKKEHVTWAQVAYQCGFSDQSHFIKEFKHFSGFNPEEFITQDLNQDPPNFFPLDRQG